MTNLALPNKDDYPGAAKKHLDDADALIAAKRFDGAGYLVGYAVECSLRTVIMVGEIAQRGRVAPARLAAELHPEATTLKRLRNVAAGVARAQARGHDLNSLVDAAAGYDGVLNASNARYAPVIDKNKPPFGGAWTESIRYRTESSVLQADAEAWLVEAERVYKATVGAMRRDGVIRS